MSLSEKEFDKAMQRLNRQNVDAALEKMGREMKVMRALQDIKFTPGKDGLYHMPISIPKRERFRPITLSPRPTCSGG